MAGQDFDALKKQATSRDFKPVPLGLKASIGVKNAMRTIESRNVLGKIEGSDPQLKDEYVVYTAHWDHFGIGAPVNGDKIYNGALDNASGVAAMLEIAHELTQVKPAPRRSMLFLAVTAEEQGLLGSMYYAVTPVYPLAKTLANINIDGINQWGRTKDITVVGLGASDLDDYLRDAAAEQSRTLRPDPEPEKGFYYRSDHFNFAKLGVPGARHRQGRRVHRQADGILASRSAMSTRSTTTTRRPIRLSPTGICQEPWKTRSCWSPSATAWRTPRSSPSGSRGTSSRRSGMR